MLETNFETPEGEVVLIDSRSTHQLISSSSFSGGVLATRDIPVGNSDEIVSTYEGDLKVIQPTVESKRAD